MNKTVLKDCGIHHHKKNISNDTKQKEQKLKILCRRKSDNDKKTEKKSGVKFSHSSSEEVN